MAVTPKAEGARCRYPPRHRLTPLPMTTPSAPRSLLDESRLDGILGYAMARASVTTTRLFNRSVGEPLGLRPVEFTLLQLIEANPDTTQKHLCELLRMPAPQMTLILDRLLERDWVRRERDQKDRRTLRLRLTEEGSRLAAQSVEALRDGERALDKLLSPGERTLLRELLVKIAG